MERSSADDFRARMDHLEGCLRRHPDWSDTRLAKFCRVHRNTVKKLRDELEATDAIPAVGQVIRQDGSPYPYRTARLR